MSTPTPAGLLEDYPRALFGAVDAAFAGWLTARVSLIIEATGCPLTEPVATAVGEAASAAAASLRVELHALLATDVDDQRLNPLHVLRAAAATVNPLLRSLGVEPARRDEFETRAMPDDVFALGPLAWIDLGEEVHDAGISWGAWKAATVLTRRRAEGKVQ